jgi:hypothetical protein
VGFGVGIEKFASQTQSQFSEFDDNMSAVIMNYENLAGFIESSEAQNPGHSRRPRPAEIYATHNGPRYQNAARVRAGHGLVDNAFGSGANHMGTTQTAPRFTQNLRQDRSNLSSTLCDFIRENDSDPNLAQHGG